MSTIRRHTTVPKVDPSTSCVSVEITDIEYNKQVNDEISKLPVSSLIN